MWFFPQNAEALCRRSRAAQLGTGVNKSFHYWKRTIVMIFEWARQQPERWWIEGQSSLF
jgi:ABC-type molybdenum transport system ATPase subunit/photorepair protein PhrA